MSISARTTKAVLCFSRVLAFGCGVALQQIAAFGEPASLTGSARDEVVSRFRLGPFFEYRATREGGVFWAVRPFYADVRDPVSDTHVTDVAWPLGTFHRDHQQSWWRLLLAYGSDDDVTRDDAAWKTVILPVWFEGRTRAGEDYWALFPLYGHLPHMALMDDIDFTLFPLYFNYEVNGVERVYTPWPFFSRLTENPHLREEGVFPFWCRQINTKKKTDRRYVLWPFWNSARYEDERNPGSSFLLFPLYGEVNRARESQRLVLPPFFSYARTDSAERWRLPWPFYETREIWETRTTEASFQRSYWPFYGEFEGSDERRRYAAWPLLKYTRTESPKRLTERTRFFPFYTCETIWQPSPGAPGLRETERYTRVWPFFVRETTSRGSRFRALEFNLIRHSGGIERNWAPFWTLYERVELPSGMARHDLLWGLVRWTTGRRGGSE
ncbi:MAG TPA: hypothetical protein P5125_04480 [Kiritimatiellia bacterium]|jgi:hypothetical protein|nr:hypothetical protein [Kiritimatiellia bacterium]HPC48786.1 hypothetical protein [Kiritimatiellia bacterium]HPW75182.1 hypothetical protein [Kiritimatiellia bacterium]HRU19594.1 hypothetical protein [Kiritimatiellia bacterium]